MDETGKVEASARRKEALFVVAVACLGLKAMVVQGDSPRILRRAVGHISETALPGEFGNVALG
jgi:sortase (surface protein transpeptidase)